MIDAAYLGVVTLGLLHGLEPGHGWPAAVLYSARKKRPIASAVVSSGIVGLGHLVSSVAVVVAYILLQSWLDFEAPWIKYVAAGLLLFLAVRLFLEKPDEMEKQHGHLHEESPEVEHDHQHRHADGTVHEHSHRHSPGLTLSLFGLASFAFILGFAHEEEFALLALIAGGVNAWVLMISYGISVLIGLVLVTTACVKAYKYLQPKLSRYERYVPKIGAAILVVMATIIVFW